MRTESKPLILVVEDEAEMAKLIALHLEAAGMQTQIYDRSAPALRFLQKNFANLLLLDINLPDQSGFALVEELRGSDRLVPTIFLTGDNVEMSKVRGFELGGDDYVTKPFSFPELVARIRAVLRRSEAKTDLHITKNVRVVDQPFDFSGARVNPLRLEIVFADGKAEKIGRKELGILAHLNENRDGVIPRKALIHAVWGIHADVKSRSLDQYIVKIRELFKRHGIELDNFRTIHGVGYILAKDERLAAPPAPKAPRRRKA